MATVPQYWSEGPEELHNGDRMTQKEFHRIYETMPEKFKAELIGGIVYVASPLKRPHSKHHIYLAAVMVAYEAHTPGVDSGDNATIIMGTDDEPQPDLYLRVLPECGGQSRDTEDEYIEHAPELVAEVAASSRSHDLHAKRQRYTQFGVQEYIVVCLRPRQLRWYDLRSGQEYAADSEGIVRSVIYPGLWMHGDALFHLDYQRLMATLNQGLATAEHTDFVARLAAARKPPGATPS